MRLYHGTSEKIWDEIRRNKFIGSKKPCPILYLAQTKKYAEEHGSVLLEIDFKPLDSEIYKAHFCSQSYLGSFQVETRRKIALSQIKRIH